MSEEADDLLADNLPDPAMIAALIPLVQGHFLFVAIVSPPLFQ